MDHLNTLAAIIQGLLIHKHEALYSHEADRINPSGEWPISQKGDLWINALEQNYEQLLFWVYQQYRTYASPDQLMVIMDEGLLEILSRLQSNVPSQNIDLGYLTNLLQVFFDNYFFKCE